MVYFKACPRCRGDMHINRDMYGAYRECLQCGYMVDVETPGSLTKLAELAPARKKKAAA